jgi:hypothetical protein
VQHCLVGSEMCIRDRSGFESCSLLRGKRKQPGDFLLNEYGCKFEIS